MIKKFAGVQMSDIRHSGGYCSLMEVAIAAATCIAAVPANEPTTHLRAHDSLLHLRCVILLHPPHLPSHKVPSSHPPTSSYPCRDPFTRYESAVHRRATVSDPSRGFLLERHWESCAYTNRVRTFLRGAVGGRPFRARPTLGLRHTLGLRQRFCRSAGAGSRVHTIHHRTDEGAFQPFFCWWDAGLEWIEPKTGAKSKNESI
jgi:hypothetical protein